MARVLDSSDKPFSTVYEVVCHWAKLTPNATALVGEGHPPLSYSDLLTSIDAIGKALNRFGIGRNDRVAIMHPGGRDMALTILGVWSYATAVPLNPGSTLAELAFQLRELCVGAVAIAEDMDTPAWRAAEMLALPVLELASENGNTVVVAGPDGNTGSMPHKPGPAQADDIVVVLSTSGTTAHSKVVPIRNRQLVCANVHAARALDLRPDDRCLNMLHLFHYGGIGQGLSTSLISGGSVGILTNFSVRGFFDASDALEPTWCTGAYTFYNSIYRNLAGYQHRIDRVAPKYRFLRTGTGSLNPRTAEELELAFCVPIIETYGSSETGAVTSEPLPPGRRKAGSVGPLLHDKVAILDDAGVAVCTGTRGEIAVRGPTVFDGYENDEAANRAAFVDGWFRTGDLGYLDADNYLFVTGRIKELINRGGQKITPNEIDDALLAHPDILVACTFSLPHSTLGEDIAAAVVRKERSSLSERSLLGFLREKLAEYKVPRRIIFVDEIPKGPTGKFQRHKLAAAVGMTREAEATAATDENRRATPLESRLQALWASALGCPNVGLHDEFFTLGGDSLQAVELFLRIEKVLGCQLPRSVLFEASTVAEMAKRIETTTLAHCLVPIQPTGNRPIFFGVHDVNGQVLNFRPLAQHLGEDQPFYGIQSIGIDGSEAPLARIEDMAARYISEICRIQPTGPYYLGGYSMGGLVAFEMARQLRAMGQDVGILALLDTYPRHGDRRAGLLGWIEQDGTHLPDLTLSTIAHYLRQGLRHVAQNARTAVWRRLFGIAWRFYESSGLTLPKQLHKPVAANYLAARSYRLRYYDGDAVLFAAAPYAWDHGDPHDGWRRLIGGKLYILSVSGLHHQILEEPHVRDLAQKLSACISARTRHQPCETEDAVVTGLH
jgi:acyl-CoA synthetase (AMP-forming)/AMP-acid ligase II/thioesterase domain-containing protein/acyl carrier protein